MDGERERTEDDKILSDTCRREIISIGHCECKQVREKKGHILAWIMYIAPIAPPALLKTHSSSLFRCVEPTFSSNSETMYWTMARVSFPWAAIARWDRSCRWWWSKM